MKILMTALAFGLLSTAPVVAQTRVEIGLLSCVIEGGVGFIIGSSKELACTFEPGDGRPAEHYVGAVRKIGIDIGITRKSYVKWGVLAPSAEAYSPGALAGTYVGGSAEASVGVGLGANALVGGSGKTFVLQPLSVQAQEGLDIAAGLTSFELRSAN